MALSLRKRVASAELMDERALKKQMVEDSKVICATLKRNSDLPADVLSALCGAAPFCLTQFADQRHEHQNGVVKMIGGALGEMEANLRKAVQDAEAKVGHMDKGKLEEAYFHKVRNLAAAKGVDAHKEADRMQANAKVTKTNETLTAAIAAQKFGDADFHKLAYEKQKIQSLVQIIETFGFVVPEKKSLTRFEFNLKAAEVDPTLIAVCVSIFRKTPADRSGFDATSIQDLNDFLATKIPLINETMALCEPGKAERAAAVTAAQTPLNAAVEAFNTAQAAEKDAKTVVAKITSAMLTDETNVNNFAKASKTAADALNAAEKELDGFQTGPLAIFGKLSTCVAAEVPEGKAAPPMA